MGLLRSERQIHSGLRVITHALIGSRFGRSSPLMHLSKEVVCLDLDQEISEDCLLSPRCSIHGNEIGIQPNEIFESYQPLGAAVGKYARAFGLFTTFERGRRTFVLPMTTKTPDISDVVTDVNAFVDEALFLKNLTLDEKIVLSTHRNMEMSRNSHKTVCELFIDNSNHLLASLSSRAGDIMIHIDNMNECADEMVKKSGKFPAHARLLKSELLEGLSETGRLLGKSIHPHDNQLQGVASISRVVLRGSHLVRSILYEKGLYSRKSKPVKIQLTMLDGACESSNISFRCLSGNCLDAKSIIQDLQNVVFSLLNG